MTHETQPITILGIETSCDETAAAIVTDTREIRANIVLSQTLEHAAYGGVVPEIAARAHMEHVQEIITQALAVAQCGFEDIDAIAVTAGPGLIGGVIVGVMTAKAIASVHNKPFIAVNHLEGHALTVRLTNDVSFPYLLLLVSGGHCQFLVVHGVGNYTLLGQTLDDALGEAFDKVAKMLGLPQPGGPNVEKMARQGNPLAYDFPVPLRGREGCDFSFSGLKTAVRQQVTGDKFNLPDICASFQHTACLAIADRTRHAISQFKQHYPDATQLVVAGGVAANTAIRSTLENVVAKHDMTLTAPPIHLCTDNGAMIAWAGMERFKLGLIDSLDFEPRARWSLAPNH